MQSLTSFFEDNKLLAPAAVVAAILVLLIAVFLIYRLLFGRRLRAAANGRTRQPRLGIVDAYDLDRQRQLVLVRRDNVEHLIMIGGPTDVVIESAIVRNQAAGSPREKDGGGPLLGTVAAPVSLPASAAPPALPPAMPGPQPVAARAEPALGRPEPLAARGEPAVARPEATPRQEQANPAGRTEPALGRATLSPIPERVQAERPVRPAAASDPAASQAGGGDPAPQPMRPAPPRPAGLPPRPSPAGLVGGSPAGAPDRAARPPLPPRPPVERPPLPPRPSLASSLPPRPPRPVPPQRPEGAPAAVGEITPPPPPSEGAPSGPPRQGPEVDTREQGPTTAQTRPEGAPPGPRGGNIESLESLEEEMAKLLGRPAPRRDG